MGQSTKQCTPEIEDGPYASKGTVEAKQIATLMSERQAGKLSWSNLSIGNAQTGTKDLTTLNQNEMQQPSGPTDVINNLSPEWTIKSCLVRPFTLDQQQTQSISKSDTPDNAEILSQI